MAANGQTILLSVQRDGGTVTLAFGDGETLELAPDSLPAELPQPGQPVEASLLARLRRAAERKGIARRLFRLLDRQLYPMAVLRDKLLAEGFDGEGVAEVCQEFEAKGLHSDRQFAEAYCRDSLKRRPVGRRYLLAKLRERRIPSAVARRVVADLLPGEREAELALMAARKRWIQLEAAGPPAKSGRNDRHGAGAPISAGEAKLIRFLENRGFPTALARKAARKAATASEEGG